MIHARLRGRRGVPLPLGDRGAVTAETAVALPTLLLVAGVLIAALAWVAGAVRCHDAAGHLARAVARGEAPTDVEALAAALVPPDAQHRIRINANEVAVNVTEEATLPWARLLPAPSATVIVPREPSSW